MNTGLARRAFQQRHGHPFLGSNGYSHTAPPQDQVTDRDGGRRQRDGDLRGPLHRRATVLKDCRLRRSFFLLPPLR
jgi:hypothetical protein